MPVVDDVGSGVLADDLELLAEEPSVRRSVRAGAAVVCFSADKLLGGPQGGLLVGTSEAIEACRRHPLARAVRIDKLSLAALEATLALYRDPELARAELPVLTMLDASADTLDARARRLADGCGGEVVASTAKVGGGALPLLELPGPAVAIEVAPGRAAARRRPAGGRPHRRRPAAARRPHAHRRGGRPGGGRRPRRAGMTSAQPLTLGTAGHIDHGKTALVAALTGRNTDRLPAEKARGISIELGYAPLRLTSGRRLSVVDAPGHERFVRTMVAGATGIDLYLMVVAADDGVMPQTREHAAVLAALGVATGVVAVTKADLTDPARAGSEASVLLPQATIVPCSARTGAGIEDVRAALDDVAGRLPARDASAGAPLLHVDRAFTIRGAGTVVTGTLWAGTIAPGDRLELLPAGTPVRVRAVQIHDEPVERADAGQRVAVNLVGVERRDVARGDVIAAPGAVEPSLVLDCDLTLRDVRHGMRAHVHHGTRETAARLVDLGGGLWQARLEQPLMARAGDRVVVRSVAPPDTLGGGVVLDPAARRHGRHGDVLARLERLRRGEPEPSPSPSRSRPPHRSRTRRPHCPTPPSRSRSACASPATSRRTPATSRPTTSPHCARPGARCGWGARCTPTPTRWRPCAPGSRPSSPPRARSRWRACATSCRPRASSRRRTSSISTPSA